ncbi:MAG: TrpB-like pyridoxal phosphate-dependent enzyme [Candidatus Bathyarchaeota archaeon]|nr:TrpB-like pyridoxal phosphate-dependent enzyme [Candidatus Bathyarchaeum tardum]WNZ28678.1 MAG: TrpB-like pyridoxal phosphate-dependent enzyme [Candidatus Bathyarchaeota archaeon]
MTAKKILLDENEMPKQWYNILPDLPKELPPMIHPGTREPVKLPPPLFPSECLKQEYSTERWIDIPEPVREALRIWRPSPLFRATGLEKALKTPAKIYYKYEGVSPSGSHKTNTAVAQAYYAVKDGLERVTTETGAGQWGSALSFSAQYFGVKATVYMVSASYHQKPYRKSMIETWGAEVFPSPTNRTKAGRAVLEADPDSTGSLGIAISEAVEEALTTDNVKYTIGSVVNHVLLHQTVIGLETQKQLAMVDDYPDQIIGCIGGGSSFSGIYWPFYYDKVKGKAPKQTEFIAVESAACPKVTRGYYTYDHGDTAKIIPLVKMHTVGHTFIPAPIHAGGLRYHGMAPTVSLMKEEGEVSSRAYNQLQAFDAASLFAKTEGIIPAPEPSHAIKGAIDEALKCKETGEEKTIVFLLCGHGHFDMKAYDDYNHGNMLPYEYPQAKVNAAMKKLKALYPWLNNELCNIE